MDETTKMNIRWTQESIEIMVKSSHGNRIGGNKERKLTRQSSKLLMGPRKITKIKEKGRKIYRIKGRRRNSFDIPIIQETKKST